MSGFLAPSRQFNDFLQMNTVMSADGASFAPLSGFMTIDALTGGAGHVASTKKVELTEVHRRLRRAIQNGRVVVIPLDLPGHRHHRPFGAVGHRSASP